VQVCLPVREFRNYPGNGEAARRIEPPEPLKRADPVMNTTVETVGLIFSKLSNIRLQSLSGLLTLIDSREKYLAAKS